MEQLMQRLGKVQEVVTDLGFDALRPHQTLPIQTTLAEKDQFVILPTGGGKSLCYIVPTLAAGFKTLIFSPLVALIKDQHESLLKKRLGAGAVSSLYSKSENDRTLTEWKRGDLDFLLIAPERLKNEDFLRAIRAVPPDMIVVDEIHVASEHGFNFRPDYRKIAPFVNEIDAAVFLGLTATFTQEVEEDLRTIFNMKDAVTTAAYYERTNLEFVHVPWVNDSELLERINDSEGSTIVYFSTVRRLEETYKKLHRSIDGGVAMYHGSLTPANKDSNQTMFMNGSVRVIFATVSFGMGVDKQDIRNVIQVTLPGSLEELIQAFGRGGRDEKPCRCVYYLDPNSKSTQEFFLDTGYPPKAAIVAYYNVVAQRADGDNLCHLKVTEICRLAGINTAYAQAIASILQGEGVLERVKQSLPLRVKPLRTPKTPTQQRYLNKVVELGVRNPDDGFYEVDLEFLAEELGVNPGQVSRTLKTISSQEDIELDDPGSFSPLRVTKPLSEVDFRKIQERRIAAQHRLKLAEDFWYIPPKSRHPYLKKYFSTTYAKPK